MLCRKANKECTHVELRGNGKHELRTKKVILLVRRSKGDADSRGRLAMRRIPTLLEVERRHILHTLHSCGNNRTLTAKVLGVSARSLTIKLHRYEKAGFTIPVPLARNEVRGEVNVGGVTQGRKLPEHETAATDVIEELISVVEAITERAQPGDAGVGRMTQKKEST